MLDKNTVIKVTNRDSGSVGYSIPEMGITRLFQRGEVKELTMEELRKLSYLPGGQMLLNECLVVHNQEALEELNPDYEPEYFYTETEVSELLLRGSLEQFLDCLDFAPEGVIELVKDLAVKLEINDLSKRKAIFDKTGFDVSKAIMINHESAEEDAEDVAPKARRAATPVVPKSEPAATGRRTTPVTTGKYSKK